MIEHSRTPILNIQLDIAAGKKDEKAAGVHKRTLHLHENNLLETVAFGSFCVWTLMCLDGDVLEISVVKQECTEHWNRCSFYARSLVGGVFCMMKHHMHAQPRLITHVQKSVDFNHRMH